MTPSDHQGTRSERDPRAFEDDPTGIRELLASLPEPPPMPADLVQRIEARLATEQAHRDAVGADDESFAARSDTVVDLAAERSRRRPGRTVALLGVAAAGLLVATVAIGELVGGGPFGPAFDGAAQVSPRLTSDSALGGRSASDTEGEAGAETPVELTVLPGLGTVNLSDYHEHLLRASDLADADAGEDAGDATADALTPAAALSCWKLASPTTAWPTVEAAPALLDDDPVVVLLGRQDTSSASTGEAVVLPWSCTTGADVEPLGRMAWGS